VQARAVTLAQSKIDCDITKAKLAQKAGTARFTGQEGRLGLGAKLLAKASDG
jgi:hypothetical protein